MSLFVDDILNGKLKLFNSGLSLLCWNIRVKTQNVQCCGFKKITQLRSNGKMTSKNKLLSVI